MNNQGNNFFTMLKYKDHVKPLDYFFCNLDYIKVKKESI